jgi:ankyrin repeat protein
MDDPLFESARTGDIAALREQLDRNPDLLHSRAEPYEWSLLHFAAAEGHLAAVELLLTRGLDVNTREKGDHTYAMHWAAAAGHLDVVRRLIEAGGDVVGSGDDHQLEVIGWATCWDGCDDAAHRAVVALLVERGAQHHIFSAIAMDLPDDVRRIVAADRTAINRRMSRNEVHQMPLHFAVRKNRAEMVVLLLELGADPLGRDGDGFPVAAYVTTPEIDRPVMQAIAAMTAAELASADRGQRPASVGLLDVIAALSLRDWPTADRLLRESPSLFQPGSAAAGALHLMAKRNDLTAVQWLLDRGADANARWPHWNSEVTPLHLAVLGGHVEMVRRLLTAGADPRIKDSAHDSDALGWAEFFRREDLVQVLHKHRLNTGR